MTELKVFCDCGQKYKFDVEPVDGRMPFTVACPVCGRDGTDKANEMLKQMAVFKLVDPPPAPAPITAAPPSLTPAPPASPARLRISAAAPMAAHTAPPPLGVGPARVAGTPPTISGMARRPVAVAETAAGKPPNFGLGLLGGFIGALAGASIYFAIFKLTGPIILLRYFLAIGVGALAGWLANLLGRGEGSKELGGLTALFTIIGIVAAQYFLTLEKLRSNEDINSINQTIRDGGYAESVKQAKEVVKAIPTGSDAEIRVYLAKEQAEDGESPKPEKIGNDEVKQFRDNELTNYLDLASGKLTKEAFWAKNGFDPEKAKKILDTEDKAMTGLAAVMAVFKAGIISIIVGAGTALKLSTNARGE